MSLQSENMWPWFTTCAKIYTVNVLKFACIYFLNYYYMKFRYMCKFFTFLRKIFSINNKHHKISAKNKPLQNKWKLVHNRNKYVNSIPSFIGIISPKIKTHNVKLYPAE